MWFWKSSGKTEAIKITPIKEESKSTLELKYEKIFKEFPVGTFIEYLGIKMVICHHTNLYRPRQLAIMAEYENHVTGEITENHWYEDMIYLFDTVVKKV